MIDLDTTDITPAAPAVSTNPAYARNIEDGAAATTKQIDLIVKLSHERDITGTPTGRRTIALAREFWKLGLLGKSQASTVITDLLALPKVAATTPAVEPEDSAHAYELADERRIAEAQAAVPVAEPQEGMHQLGQDIFKVQRSPQTGRLYAKKLIDGSFQYAIGAIRKLNESTYMTIDQVKAYGTLYETCVRCGRTLTAEDSIDRMMGPVCFGKQFG